MWGNPMVIKKVDPFMCTGCTICVASCPADVLRMRRGKALIAYPENCTGCFICEEDCPRFAIDVS